MNFAYGGMGVFPTYASIQGPNITTQIDFFQNLITDNVFNISDLQSSVTLVTLAGNDYFAYIIKNGGAQVRLHNIYVVFTTSFLLVLWDRIVILS
jgi:hypothetical protein